MALNPTRMTWFAILLLASGCSSTQTIKHGSYSRPIVDNPVVLLMNADVEVGALTAVGSAVPNAVWTDQARRNVDIALHSILESHNASLVAYEADDFEPAVRERHREISRLYDVVGLAMLTRADLPTAKAKTDWTLGPGVQDLQADASADYALFVYLRDQEETAGHIAFAFALMLFGISVPSATQYGYAGLVDLQTGDIVWFNTLKRITGDLRTQAPATDAVELLLDDCPIL